MGARATFWLPPAANYGLSGQGTGPLRPSQSTSNQLRQRGFSMQSRFLTAVALGLLTFGASAVAAQAQVYDPDGRYSGGQTSRRYEVFGGTSDVGSVKRNTGGGSGHWAPGP